MTNAYTDMYCEFYSTDVSFVRLLYLGLRPGCFTVCSKPHSTLEKRRSSIKSRMYFDFPSTAGDFLSFVLTNNLLVEIRSFELKIREN